MVRSGVENGSPPLSANAPATTDVQRKLRKGTTSACTLRSACTGLENAETRLSRFGSTTRPSLGPLTRATSIATATSSEQSAKVARSNRYRGRANLGNQEEPAPGSRRADDARLAACHRFRKGEGVAGKKRKSVTALVPARIVRAPGPVPVRRSSCRSRQATSGPKYTRQTRTKKCGQGRANGGLGRGERRRSHVGERVEQNDESHLGSQSDHNGSRSGKGPG